jgi:hypothetical protein
VVTEAAITGPIDRDVAAHEVTNDAPRMIDDPHQELDWRR